MGEGATRLNPKEHYTLKKQKRTLAPPWYNPGSTLVLYLKQNPKVKEHPGSTLVQPWLHPGTLKNKKWLHPGKTWIHPGTLDLGRKGESGGEGDDDRPNVDETATTKGGDDLMNDER